MDLQPFAFVIGIDADIAALAGWAVLFLMPLGRFFCGFVVNECVALDQMERVAARRAVAVHHRHALRINPHRIDDEGVAFIMSDGIAPRARHHFGRVGSVETHMPNLIILIVDHGQAVLGLEDFHAQLHGEMKWRCIGRALIGRVGKIFALRRHFAAALYRGRGFGLENGVVVVTDQSVGVADPAPQAPHIGDGLRTARKGLEIEGVAAPASGEIGDIVGGGGGPGEGG